MLKGVLRWWGMNISFVVVESANALGDRKVCVDFFNSAFFFRDSVFFRFRIIFNIIDLRPFVAP
jgi:hypothetical protein